MKEKYVSLNRLSLFLNNLKNTFAPLVHSHAICDVTDLQSSLDDKQDVAGMDEYATIRYVDSKDPYEILDNGNVVFASDIIANKDVSLQKTSTRLDNLRATVGNLEQDIENTINTRVKLFHATLDPVTTQYIKDSGDFTYADVAAIENCKIEATFGNVKIILSKEVHRNIEPDPIAGRYVEFSALLRNGLTTVKVFFFVYDPENLPTDPASVAALENWGNSQYCGIAVQHIVIGDFLDNDIMAGRNNTINAPSTKAVGDYTDSQCESVMNYMQTTFADNIIALCNQRFAPHIIYDDPTGFEANDEDVGHWQLTGLNLTPYKRLKFYIKAAENGSTGSPSHIVEIHLDDRAKNAQGHFTGGHTAIFPDATGKFHNVICSVSGDKTALAFNRANRYSASTSATSKGGRQCYLIEGYMI